jgi:hypothetical protein
MLMRRLALTGLAAVGLLGFLTLGRASAQYSQFYGPAYRPGGAYGSYGRGGPALSPYLNLTRGGNPAANYFLGVLPEIDRRATKAEVGTMISDLERRLENPPAQPLVSDDVIGGLTGGGLPPTGHAAMFTNYSSYYGLTPPGAQVPRPAAAQVRGR